MREERHERRWRRQGTRGGVPRKVQPQPVQPAASAHQLGPSAALPIQPLHPSAARSISRSAHQSLRPSAASAHQPPPPISRLPTSCSVHQPLHPSAASPISCSAHSQPLCTSAAPDIGRLAAALTHQPPPPISGLRNDSPPPQSPQPLGVALPSGNRLVETRQPRQAP